MATLTFTEDDCVAVAQALWNTADGWEKTARDLKDEASKTRFLARAGRLREMAKAIHDTIGMPLA